MSLSAATQSCDQFGQATTHKLWRNLQHAPLILIETTQQATDGQQHGSEPQQWVTIIPVQSSGHELLDMPGYDWIPRHLRASQECCHLISAQMWTTIAAHTFHRHRAGAGNICRFFISIYMNISFLKMCWVHACKQFMLLHYLHR